MRRVNHLLARWHLLFFLIAILVVAADQFSKFWIRSNIAINQSWFDMGFFRITNIQNSGAAFGIFYGRSAPLAIISVIGAIVIIFFAIIVGRRLPSLDTWLTRISLGFILGGTVGNLIDRMRLGYVTDFLDFHVWPAFNVADSSLTIGIIMFACSILFASRAKGEADNETRC